MPALPQVTDKWILSLRGPRAALDPRRPYAWLIEPERTRAGRVEEVATIFLTNKECPFRCLMCDLWRHTTAERVPEGAVAEQVAWALRQMPGPRHVKLYNAGNFFDLQAIPRDDRRRIGERVRGHETVIVECHPRLVQRDCLEFAERLQGRLEVAMGLETIDPAAMALLNKRMTLDDYAGATRRLTRAEITARAFILLRCPPQSESEGIAWARRSIAWAFETGVECCVVIPTRGGNGAMERMAEAGAFEPPAVGSLLEVLEYGLSLRGGRVFADLWDLRQRADLSLREREQIDRMALLNLTQDLAAANACAGAAREPAA